MKWLTQLTVFIGMLLAQAGAFASPAVTNLTENRFLQFDNYLMTNNVPATWVHEGPLPASGSAPNRALLAGTNHYHRAGWLLRSCRAGTSAYLGYGVPPRNPTAAPVYPAVATNLAANLQNAYGAFIESPALTNGVGAIYFDAINNQTAYTNQLTVEIATNMVNVSTSEIIPTVLPPSTNGLNYVWAPLDVFALAAANSNDLVRYGRSLNVRKPVKVRVRQTNGVQAGQTSPDTAFAVVDNIRLSLPPAEVAVTNATAFSDSGGYKVRCFVSNVDTNVPATARVVTAYYRWLNLTNVWSEAAMAVAVGGEGDGNGNGERYEVMLPAQLLGGDLEFYVKCAFDGYWYAATDYTGLGYAGYPSENRSPYTSSVQTQLLAGADLYLLTVNNGTGGGPYTNGQQVVIAANAPALGMAFARWTGDTQHVDSVIAPSAVVTMPGADIALTATYTNLYYALTVTSGTGGGSYTNGQQVAIGAAPLAGKIFSRWIGATQYVANVFATNTTVTMPAADAAVEATYLDSYALTVSGGSGSGSYTNGQQVAIAAAAPAPGMVFHRWAGDIGYVASATASNTLVTMPAAPISLTATYVNVYTLTVSGGSGSGSYTNGQQVAIVAGAPAPGKAFLQWVGDTASVANVFASSTTVTMPASAAAVTATYVDVFTLTVNGGTGGGSYTNGQQAAIAATSLVGMAFDRWIGATQYVANVYATNTTVTMPAADIAVTALFTNIYYTLTVSSGTGGGSYTNGQPVAIAADAQAGKVFDRWTGSTQYVANVFATNTTVTMPAASITLTATYINLYALTVESGSGGGSYTNGQQVAIMADAPVPGKAFRRWTGDTASVANVFASSTTLTMPASAIAVTATYVDVFTLTVNGGTGGGSYTNGQQVAIAAGTPAPGTIFDRWTGDTASVANVFASSTTVTMPGSAIAVTATYVNIHTLTVTSGTGGGPYTNGQQVLIVANAALTGQTFARWTGATQYVADVRSPVTQVTMPPLDIGLTATYSNLYYRLTVTGGAGGGVYTNGQVVAITANVPVDKTFDRWTGDTGYVANQLAPNTTVTMPAANVSLAVLLSSLTSVLPDARFLHFNDYLLTNAANAVWVHEGPLPGSGAATFRALLAGTNHYHRTGWRLFSCRTGSAAYLGTSIPPRVPTTVPSYPTVASNLAANLRYELGAAIESPVFTNGIGTIYFETVINTTDAGQLTLETATRMQNTNTFDFVNELITPTYSNQLDYYWETIRVLDLLTTNEFTRVNQLLNHRGPIKLRLRRTGELNPLISSRDTAFIVVDNIRVSIPPTDAVIYKTINPFEPGYPNVNTGLTVRCYVSNVDTNVPTDSRAVKCVYRWRFLDQLVFGWRTNTMTYVEGTGDGRGNGERFEAVLAPYSEIGDLEYFFVCDFAGYIYQSPDYTGLGYTYPTENLSPRRHRGTDLGGAEFKERLREFASHYQALYAEVDGLAAPVTMRLVGDHQWRAAVPIAGTGITNLTWRFKAVGKYVPLSEAATPVTTYWAGISGVSGGRVPYGGLCVAADSEERLNVLVDTGNYILLTLNTESWQYLASRGEYQNFNLWPAPVNLFSQSNGQDPKTGYYNNFDAWPTNQYRYGLDDDGQGIALEAIVGYVSSTNVYSRDPFGTPAYWLAGSAGYAAERTLVDNSINAIPGITPYRNLALRLRGGDGTLGLGYVHNRVATLPDGLKEFSFRCRLSEDANAYDVAYYRYGFTDYNYLVRATAKAVSDVSISPGNPSVSLMGYYRDPDNFYEYRVVQIADGRDTTGAISDKRVSNRLYRWKNGIPTLLVTSNMYVSAAPLTSISDAAPLEMRLYNQSGTNTIIRCKYGSSDNVIFFSDASTNLIQSGSFGFLSTECYASCSAVRAQPTTVDAAPTGAESYFLRQDTDLNFTTDVANWYLPNGRCVPRADVTPKGIYSVTPSQPMGIYVQDTTYGSDTEPTAPGTEGWRLYKTVTVNSYNYQRITETVKRWNSQYVMLEVMGGTADVTVDELAASSWHGTEAGFGASDNYDWVATESWVVRNATADANAVQLDHTRANPNLPQMIRSRRIDTGLGQMEFDYRVFRAPAKLTVQYAPVGFEGNEEDWVDVQSYVVSNTVGWTHSSTYLGLSEPGFFRLLNDRRGGYTNAWVEIDNMQVWDEPEVTNNAWIAYNVKITSTETNRVMIDQSKACFLNNSQTLETAPTTLDEYQPYLMSPELPRGLGGISFYARAYTNNQAATLYVYASTSGWNAAESLWFEVARFSNITNGLYKLFNFEPEDGRTYDAIKLGTLTSGGARRVCLDEITLSEPIFPGFDIVNVKLLTRGTEGEYIERPQPLEGEDLDVEARLANQQMTPSNIVMYVSYFVGTNGWGIGNWNFSQAKTRRMLPVTTNANETLYRTVPEGTAGVPFSQTGGIAGQDRDLVVQYYVWATYMGGIPLEARQETFDNPYWYFPVDLNVRYAAQGWSPYFFVYGVPLGAVWINEINALDGVVNPETGQTVYGIWDNQYIEIAVPAWLDLAGWSVDLVTSSGYVTRSINLPPGLPEQTALTNGYAFFVIGDAYQSPGIPALPKKDYGYPDLSYHMPRVNPGGLRLRRPLGMYEQAVAYDWDPSPVYGISFYGENWATNDPERRFVYVGIENNGGSLARIGTYDSTNTWVFPQTWTPGTPNIGQQFPLNGDALLPGVSNVFVTSLLNRDKGTQNGRRVTYYQLKLRKGTSTNIFYQADDWYRLTSVKKDQVELLVSGSELQTYDLPLPDLQQGVDVLVDISLRQDLSELEGNSRVLDWVLSFDDSDLVPMYYNGRILRLEEQYWLDANPTVSNTFEMAITRFVIDPGTNFHLTVKMALNDANKTSLQGDAVLKLEAKGSIVERDWKMMAQYSLNSGSFDSNHTCRLYVPNPFGFILSDVDPRNLFLRWVIEWQDPRVTVQTLAPND